MAAQRILHAFLGLIFISCQVSAGPVKIDGIDVQMEPPPGFTPASAFLGFQNVQSFSTIEVREVEASIDSLAARLEDPGFTMEAMRLAGREALVLGDRRAYLLQLAIDGGGYHIGSIW